MTRTFSISGKTLYWLTAFNIVIGLCLLYTLVHYHNTSAKARNQQTKEILSTVSQHTGQIEYQTKLLTEICNSTPGCKVP